MTDESNAEAPTVTFGPSAAVTIINEFGWEPDDEGYITDKRTGERIESYLGSALKVDDLGGIVKDDDGNPVPIEDNFVAISELVEDQMRGESPDGE